MVYFIVKILYFFRKVDRSFAVIHVVVLSVSNSHSIHYKGAVI